ncbi:MAG: type I-B CRISPR-associated protein Cas5b [Candidatus Helarchaeota archaeon]
MADESVLVFDIEARYGFLKVPEVTRATISFPFTRTSIVGIIASILGLERNSYWNANDPLANAKIALEIKKPIKFSSLTFNYVHTKAKVSIGGISLYMSSGSERGFVTAVKLNLLRDVHYRIYFQSKEEKLQSQLREFLENQWCTYPPYLGHANLLADIIYLGEYPLEELKSNTAEVSTVIPVSILAPSFLKIFGNELAVVYDIPIRTKVIGTEVTSTVTDNFIISESEAPLKITIDQNSKIYTVKMNDNKTNIVFMPIKDKDYSADVQKMKELMESAVR